MSDALDRMTTLVSRVVMRMGAIAVICMMVAILVQVAASRAGVTTVIELPKEWPLFGAAITLNSLTDLQWYLLSLVALIPSGVIWLRNEHVRVDFAYSAMGKRGRSLIDLLGHTIFALPFLLYMIPDAWELAVKSFDRGESSANGGLTDRYLPRGALPVCFVLLLLAIALESWRSLRAWGQRDD